jgi:CHAD domain-containing protein
VLLAVLGSWRDAPPVDQEIATKTLLKRARRAERKADRRLAVALRSRDDAMLHRARKAAKRARYAAELCKPVKGSGQKKRTVKHYKRFQSVLGDYQDTVVASAALRRMAVAAGTTAGENGFTYGLLLGREHRIADECRREARKLL